MFWKKVQKEIDVFSRENCLIYKWEIDNTQIAKSTRLNVGTGCQAAVYYNGQLVQTYEPGAYTLDFKKAIRNHDIVTIVGISRDKHFKILFGVGGVSFKDREAGLSPRVGIYGECNCRLIDGNKIYAAYGAERDVVTAADINDDLHAKLQEKLGTELAKKLEEYTYHTVFTAVSDLSNIVKEQYWQVLQNAGIELIDCSISQPHFPDSYGEERDNAIKNKTDKLYQPTPTGDGELLKEILQNKNKEQEKKEKPNNKCPHCNKENDPKSKFCNFCGRKLNK